MADVELLPCPFCGERAAAENYVVDAMVACLSCGAGLTRRHTPTEDTGLPEAIAAWNRRATAAKDAALEAAREDAARIDWLEKADYSSVGDGGISGAQITVYPPGSGGEWSSGPTVRAAIDQARGKGGVR